jgi:predicted nucleic acid-binding Zn ribbon protein
VPIIFKGPGFYVTDSRKNHNRPSDEGSTSKDKKPESE